MIEMTSLKSGVLQKLYEDMKSDDNKASEEDSRPVLLQIRSIIPVLEEGALWPNRGFFLKVSDSSHALYVSLSKEQNEMVLGNKWKLGQFIYVHKLEKANPVPLLKGVMAIPGRRPCEGSPVDIVPPADLVKLLEASAIDSVVEKGVILEKRVPTRVPRKLLRGSSDSESSSRLSKRPARRDKIKIADKKKKFNTEDCDNDSDAESTRSTVLVPKRRSWDQSDMLKVKESLDSSIVKNDIKLPPRGHSASASPVLSVKSDSSDENPSLASTGVLGSGKILVESPKESQVSADKVNDTQLSDSLCSLVSETNGAEAEISWKSLSPKLVKFGKEVVKQRDIALAAAVNALQEACVSERLLNSLSTLSQLDLSGKDDLEPYVDKFFELQDDLARTRSIIQSLTSLNSASRTTLEIESCIDNSVKESLERSQNAMMWIKSAIAADLSPVPSPDSSTNPTDTAQSSPSSCCSKPQTNPMDTIKQSSPSNCCNKPEISHLLEINTSNDTGNNNTLTTSSSEKEGLPPEWIPGSTLQAAFDLVASLQDECKNLFLSHVDSYLDEVEVKIQSTELDGRVAATMYKVKMVSDCLDMIMNQEKNSSQEGEKEGCECLNDSDTEVYERVRNKIYGILLKHVERTAMAFNRLNAASCNCRDGSC